jgi:CO/xanthine dehydrogenase Mo-binding subunit
VEIGDLTEELALCDVVVEESYKTQAQAQAMMETFRSFTYLDQAGRLVVISSTQIPFHVRRQLARALQIPATRIRVIKPRIGGGFGAKQTGVCEVYPAIVTLKTGKPAKIVYERKETFIASNSRHATEFKVRMGASRDGIIRAIDIVGLSDTGAYGEHAPTVFAVIGDKTMPLYNKTTAIRYQGHAVYTNKLPGGACAAMALPRELLSRNPRSTSWQQHWASTRPNYG